MNIPSCEVQRTDDPMQFAGEDIDVPAVPDYMWKLLIVDDDEHVHHVTRMVLADLSYDGRTIDCVSAYSDREARQALCRHQDVSVVLLDVVMEAQDSGLHLVRHIREDLGNYLVRIILRTGQPGQAPERRVIVEYDINDYREKTELSAQKLVTSVVASLRTYQAMQQLREVNANLECMVAERTRELQAAYQEIKRVNAELNAHRDLLLYEKELAKEVFQRIARPKRLEGPHIRYLLAPMDEVSGDVLLAAHKDDGGLYLMFGDFTGHGLAAALCALPVADLFYRNTKKGRDLREIIGRVNDKLKQTLPPGLFLAAGFIETGKDGSCMRIWSGGVPPIYVYGGDGRIKHRIVSADLPLGVVESERLCFAIEEVQVDADDHLFICSDGLLEARNVAGEMFGEHRLEACFGAVDSARELFDEVQRRLWAFVEGAAQADDITLLELNCAGVARSLPLGPGPG